MPDPLTESSLQAQEHEYTRRSRLIEQNGHAPDCYHAKFDGQAYRTKYLSVACKPECGSVTDRLSQYGDSSPQNELPSRGPCSPGY